MVNKIMLGELPIDKFITHNFKGLNEVTPLVDALHGGSCLRGVLHIHPYEMPDAPKLTVMSKTKLFGGVLKKVKHWSHCNQCEMKFNIFLPTDDIKAQRGKKAYPVVYYLSGLTCNENNFTDKSGFASFAKKHNLVVIVPDTSPRGLEFPEIVNNKDYKLGYGAGHYVNATAEPWSKNFNMYTYVTKELPELVNAYFPVDPAVKSVMGHSMGGNGALMVALRNAKEYQSVSAFSPIADPASSGFAKDSLGLYFGGDMEAAIPLTGQVAGRIESVAPVAEILGDVAREFEALMGDFQARYA